QPASFSLLSGCSFNGRHGNAKCEVLQQFGFALHAIEDFYSHSNYADFNETNPIKWDNPPGIGNSTLPTFWNMTIGNQQPSLTIPDHRLSSGCYPDAACKAKKRTAHEHLNKDKCDIDLITGKVTNIRSPRGQLIKDGIANEQRVVEMAIRQVRQTW